jgi:hypothetical protein
MDKKLVVIDACCMLNLLAAGREVDIELVSTLDLIHDAASSLQWSADELVHVASNLRWCGNFAPPKRDPRGAWYLALLERAGIAAP